MNIKDVAIYLRKSRGDDEDVLSKHRLLLTEYATKQGWNYTEYEEDLLSGERLATRPKMLVLLDDIADGKWDAVLVAAYDRLSRGSSKDFGTIIETMQYTNCYIATPERVYNVNDTNDLTMLGIQGVFANTELRIIKERFIRGKKLGAKDGKWTNGKPPYPYIYRKRIFINERGKEEIDADVLTDPEQKEIYLLMKRLYLTGEYSTEKLMIKMNKLGYPGPTGGLWRHNTIRRLLRSEFHMGYSIYGKYEYKTDKNNVKKAVRKRDREEWYIGRGDWEILKTEDEHRKILAIMKKHSKTPSRARSGSFPTSGLMYCKLCGHAMHYAGNGRVEVKTGKKFNFTKCSFTYPTGEKCPQRGVKLSEEFYDNLYNMVITSHFDTEIIEKSQLNQNDIAEKESSIADLERQLKQYSEALVRIKDAYSMGVYNLTEFGEEKKKLDDKIKNLRKNIDRIENEIASVTTYTRAELNSRIEEFKIKWQKASTPQEQNILLKTIVKRIIYNRQDDNVVLEVEYL